MFRESHKEFPMRKMVFAACFQGQISCVSSMIFKDTCGKLSNCSCFGSLRRGWRTCRRQKPSGRCFLSRSWKFPQEKMYAEGRKSEICGLYREWISCMKSVITRCDSELGLVSREVARVLLFSRQSIRKEPFFSWKLEEKPATGSDFRGGG